MYTNKSARRDAHRIETQPRMNPPGAARKQRHAHPMDIQHIVVASLTALKRAWNASGTACAHCTATLSGRKALRPRTHENSARLMSVSNEQFAPAHARRHRYGPR